MIPAGFRLSLLLVAVAAFCEDPLPADRGAAGLLQTLRRLETNIRVMHIVAHPDDEDGGTITWLSRGRGAEVTLLSITRGESGANLVTGDFFDRLGALRTLEVLKAAQHYGAHVRFTRFTDFGYSKTLEETLNNWDRDEVVRDLVRLIRAKKPHVVLARFRGSRRDGHGQHQAAGLLAREAFEAAGDGSWKPLKLYAGNYRENEDWTVAVDSGVYDPLLGETYAQMARRGLRFQRSQGAGSAIASPGPAKRYYKLVASEVGMADKEEDFFERLPVVLPPELAGAVREAKRLYSAEDPARCAPALAKALDTVRRLRRQQESIDLAIKERQILTALEQALGITFDVLVEPDNPPQGRFSSFMPYSTLSVAVPGQTFQVKTALYGAEATGMDVVAPSGWQVEKAGDNRFRITVGPNAYPSQAHWSRPSVWDPAYRIADDQLFGLPVPPVPVKARASYRVAGVEATVEGKALTSFVDPTGVQRRRSLAVGPAVSVRFATEAGVLPVGRGEYGLATTLRNNASRAVGGSLRLELPDGWRSEPPGAPFSFQKEGEEQEIQ
ncbi:MAG: PIG-L family deacetylase, partial [bacterium]|nr:PIG-L family deacetylase [bacterium]